MNINLPLSALIITYNEEDNIKRSLDSLHWIPNILVIDSGSTDNTLDIISNYDTARVLERSFDNFANQCNYGLGKICSRWVLSIDADFIVSERLAIEITHNLNKIDMQNVHGYSIPIRYCIAGHPIRGSIYPPRICLYQTDAGHYENEGHGHRVKIKGNVKRLSGEIYHDDRKPITRWLTSQQKYMTTEAKSLIETSSYELSYADLLRKHTPLAPLAALVLCLFWKRGIFDGSRGWTYVIQRVYAEILLLVLLSDLKTSHAIDNS
jgi:glycosyltransferase involved in cell wall biosynthesis